MNAEQKELFEIKMEERMERGFLYTGKNAIANFRKYVEAYIDDNNAGRVSDSAFEIIERAMVEAGELRPIVVEEESQLTLQEYRSMPVRQIQLKYRSDPGFKAGVESLIARGLI
jgi:hypothetical protein